MFKLQPAPTFKFRVSIAKPGSEEPETLKLLGRHKGQEELRAWGDRAKEMEGKDAAFLLEVVEGWEDVCDAEGKAVKFSAEAFGALLDAYPGSGLQVFQAYVRELSAGRTKN